MCLFTQEKTGQRHTASLPRLHWHGYLKQDWIASILRCALAPTKDGEEAQRSPEQI